MNEHPPLLGHSPLWNYLKRCYGVCQTPRRLRDHLQLQHGTEQ